jgi:hypothetical protein
MHETTIYIPYNKRRIAMVQVEHLGGLKMEDLMSENVVGDKNTRNIYWEN